MMKALLTAVVVLFGITAIVFFSNEERSIHRHNGMLNEPALKIDINKSRGAKDTVKTDKQIRIKSVESTQ